MNTLDNISIRPSDRSFDFLNEEPVSCFFCKDVFEVHENYQPFLKHLLDAHKFVIGSPEEIADFREYVIYWKKLECLDLKDYCIVYVTNTEDKAKEKSEHYYLLCDRLPEDKKLREILREDKLSFLLRCKEEECQDKKFTRQCIYCLSVIGGGVAKCFHHLTFDHGFSLGNPDNIVFGAKLLDLMEDTLKRLKCLNCEKTFKNYVILREHMRKKQHRSLNPKNKIYDKFYIINYLKPGVPWVEVKKDIFFEKEIPVATEIENRDEEDLYDEEQLWTDWKEEAEDVAAVCLFCPYTSDNVDVSLMDHMENKHSFKFNSLTKDLNFYSKVKLINYIRTQVKNGCCIGCETQFSSSSSEYAEHINNCNVSTLPSPLSWDDPAYMFPVIENDGLLIHLDDNAVDDEDTSSVASSLHEEIVLPEEVVALPSILNDSELREQLSDLHTENFGDSLVFKCLFCAFRSNDKGNEKTQCLNHMQSMHNFYYGEIFRNKNEEYIIMAINYIRYTQTELGKCYVCGKSYNTKAGLEEHRVLEEHTSLPSPEVFQDSRWKGKSAPNDGFAAALKQR